MAHRLVNGVRVEMTAQEEVDFESTRVRTLAHAKANARQQITQRAKQEQDDDRLLDVGNASAKVNAVRQNARQLWQSVQACNTVAEVDAVNLDAGW